MSKTFKYIKITSQYYLHYTDEWDEDGVEFDYEVSDYDLMEAIMPLVMSEYFLGQDQVEDMVREFIVSNDLVDFFAERYEDELHEIFKDEAFDYYND